MARSLSSELDTRQPTMRRENTSTTNATYAKPAQVATYVMSATQSWFGPEASPHMTPNTARKIAWARTSASNAFMSGASWSSSILGM